MGMPYRARVNERTLLNLPGFHGGAFIYVFVEDTSERGLRRCRCEGECKCHNFEPRTILEIADCDERISLEFDLYSDESRDNSLHKLDTLVAALSLFRNALVAEFAPYDLRESELQALRDSRGAPAGRQHPAGFYPPP
jgi:hypothetical protein